jgi:hypothetical protein
MMMKKMFFIFAVLVFALYNLTPPPREKPPTP